MDADRVEAGGVAEFHGTESVLCYYSPTQFLRALTRTFAGRVLIAGIIVKLIAFAVAFLPEPLSLAHDLFDAIGDICVLGGGLVVAYRLFGVVRARLLWRVRRKLILSYIFIGVVPALLIIVFFLLAGLLLMFSVSSYLVQSHVQALVEETRFLAEKAALEYPRLESPADYQRWMTRLAAQSKHAGTSYAVVEGDTRCAGEGSQPSGSAQTGASGPWTHAAAPHALPPWVPCGGFFGLTAQPGAGVVVRAVAPAETRRRWIVVDVPLNESVTGDLRNETGIEIGDIAVLGDTAPRRLPGGVVTEGTGLRWVTFLNPTDWGTGKPGAATAAIRLNVADVYGRISATPIPSIGNLTFGQLLLLGLALVAMSFLIIQGVALGMGFGLARSITGSVHELFAGTERVRHGDFTNKIAIRSRDQLGELAASFNSMTASIEDLLEQKAEKERLEEELRIARQIQMSLLPRGPLQLPGLALSGHCEPAREVGGDYYDFLPLADGRVGLLIADVAGKGTSAALYMAELKGLMLSLSELHRSPRQLLIDANRIIANHLDERSFITVTYAVIDPAARTLTCARAGHCPLLYRPGAAHVDRRARFLSPDGMVLGLNIDDGSMFDRVLEEAVVPFGPGDLFLLFTDGVTEAMNGADDMFGEQRLRAIVEEYGDGPPDQLRDRILREIRAFTAPEAPHDDMTMLLINIGADLRVPA